MHCRCQKGPIFSLLAGLQVQRTGSPFAEKGSTESAAGGAQAAALLRVPTTVAELTALKVLPVLPRVALRSPSGGPAAPLFRPGQLHH